MTEEEKEVIRLAFACSLISLLPSFSFLLVYPLNHNVYPSSPNSGRWPHSLRHFTMHSLQLLSRSHYDLHFLGNFNAHFSAQNQTHVTGSNVSWDNKFIYYLQRVRELPPHTQNLCNSLFIHFGREKKKETPCQSLINNANRKLRD